jgi:hypothetical protein
MSGSSPGFRMTRGFYPRAVRTARWELARGWRFPALGSRARAGYQRKGTAAASRWR